MSKKDIKRGKNSKSYIRKGVPPAPGPGKGRNVKAEVVSEWGPKDVKRFRNAARQVWRYTPMWRAVVKRCALPGGYARCEQCRKKVPKIYVDHIKAVGDVDGGFIERLMTSSENLQGLCKKCHDTKTKEERAALKAAEIAAIGDFY